MEFSDDRQKPFTRRRRVVIRRHSGLDISKRLRLSADNGRRYIGRKQTAENSSTTNDVELCQNDQDTHEDTHTDINLSSDWQSHSSNNKDSHLEARRNSILTQTCFRSRLLIKSPSKLIKCDLCKFSTYRLNNIVDHYKRIHSPDNASKLVGFVNAMGTKQLIDHLRPDQPSQALNTDSSTDKDSTKLVGDGPQENTRTDPLQQLGDLCEDDLIWVKVYRYPHWPAVVKKVYKSKKTTKVSVVFLENCGVRKPFCVSGINILKKIVPFGRDPDVHSALVRKACMSQYGQMAVRVIDKIDDYLSKKLLGKISCSALQYFGICSPDHRDNIEHDNMDEDTLERAASDRVLFASSPDQPLVENQSNSKINTISDRNISSQSASRLKKRYGLCQLLLDFCKSEEMKNYMKDLLSEQVYSHRHQLFHKMSLETCEKLVLENVSFGPIEDEEQQNELVVILNKQYKSISKHQTYQNMKYFTEVLLPECIIHAIQVTFKKSRHKAEKLYSEGFVLTKEEYLQQNTLSNCLAEEQKRAKSNARVPTCRIGLKILK